MPAAAVGCLNVVAVPYPQHFRASQACKVGHRRDPHRQRRIHRAEAQQNDHAQGKQQPRDRQQNINQTHHNIINDAAQSPGDHAQRRAHNQTQRHGN
ncbi:hypothetical protein D3C75_1007660 [compost metagenome]